MRSKKEGKREERGGRYEELGGRKEKQGVRRGGARCMEQVGRSEE